MLWLPLRPVAAAPGAPDPCPGAQTTIALDACAGGRRDAADRALRAAIASHPIPSPLLAAWRAMQHATCDDLVGVLLEGGSMRSMEETSCEARLTDEFARIIVAPNAKAGPNVVRAERDADAFAARYRRQLDDAASRSALDRSQAAWHAYFSAALPVFHWARAYGLGAQRIDDLKSTWLGEPFW